MCRLLVRTPACIGEPKLSTCWWKVNHLKSQPALGGACDLRTWSQTGLHGQLLKCQGSLHDAGFGKVFVGMSWARRNVPDCEMDEEGGGRQTGPLGRAEHERHFASSDQGGRLCILQKAWAQSKEGWAFEGLYGSRDKWLQSYLL